MPLDRVLEALEVARGPDANGERWALCPAHDDKTTPNLHVREAEDGGVLLHCFAGCSQDEVLAALEEHGVRGRDLFLQAKPGDAGKVGGRGVSLPPKVRATLQPHPEKGGGEREKGLRGPAQPSATQAQPCTLEAYAEAKKLPVEFLKEAGLSTVSYMGSKAASPTRTTPSPTPGGCSAPRVLPSTASLATATSCISGSPGSSSAPPWRPFSGSSSAGPPPRSPPSSATARTYSPT